MIDELEDTIGLITMLFGFVIASGLLVSLGRDFQADDKYQRELINRHNKYAEALIVQCIHRDGIAKFGSQDEYLGCYPLP